LKLERPHVSLALGAACAAAMVLAYLLGDTYTDRLANHAGYFLVPVEDAMTPDASRPRHTVFILVDGLTKGAADRLESTKMLAARGQCRLMTVGPITISRPVYAVVSTGLEQDRTGCRNNREMTPLAAESVWQIARRAGLRVNAVSALGWWQQLFPDGFSRYDVREVEEDYFAQTELVDLNLVHPLYVDEMGHAHGAASPEYRSAVDRADREITTFLDRIDFAEDVIVLTADHGHTSYGGHGGSQREVTEVLTCFAGRGVARTTKVGRMESTALAPAVALLAGLSFPRHMRAVQDDLDVLFEIADPLAFSGAFLADRRAAIEQFRATNRIELGRWLGGKQPATWTRLYATERRRQRIRLSAGIGLLSVFFALVAWRRRLGVRGAIGFLAWAACTVAATLALYVAERGSLDLTSINTRGGFVVTAAGICAAVLAAALTIHWLVFRDPKRLFGDQLTLIGLSAGANLLHPFVYGSPLGFPLPSPLALFFPFLASIFSFVCGAVGCAMCLGAIFWRARP
jgi:Type I phosphodiesterase / nucleotide pyrophosphatase